MPSLNSFGKRKLIDEQRNEYFFDYQFGSTGKIVITLIAEEAKQKFQTRTAMNKLVRVDINGKPHMNICGNLIKNHIHIFYPDGEETYEISSFDSKLYQNLKITNVLYDFFRQCNISSDDIIFQEVF